MSLLPFGSGRKGGRNEREETVRMRTLRNSLQQQGTVREM